ncbi:hypothetical protein ABW21_db0203987 [Orbilia brochopaga]|nr:hypothetical protein ABW21_db0203987 [Drechslerella brochopaga]
MLAKALLPVIFGILGLRGAHASPRPQTRSQKDALADLQTATEQANIGDSQPEPVWSPSGTSIYVLEQAWDGFAGNLTTGTKILENPLWYVFQAGYILRTMSRDIDHLAYQLYKVLGDEQMNTFRQEYFKTIAPVMTRFVWTKLRRESDGQSVWMFAQTKHEGDPLPTGVMDSGGILDTSFPRDDKAAQEGSANPFPRDTLTMKVLLKKLFQNTPEHHTRGTVVYASDTNFLQAWHTIKQVIDNLAPLVKEITKYANAAKWRQPAGQPKILASPYPRQTHVSLRQDVGYGDYLKSFQMTSYETGNEDTAWIDTGILGYKLGLDVPNFYVAYAALVNGVYRSALPFIMDMMADLALRANALGYETIFGDELDFALPDFSNFKVTRAELETRPQWSEDRYHTAPWPLAEPPTQQIGISAASS